MINRIQEIRTQLNITQAKLTKACGYRFSSRIGNYESGIRSPRISDARKIVEALNTLGAECSFDDVFPPEKNEAA